MKKEKLSNRRYTKKYIQYSSLAFQMLGTIVLGVFLGSYLDKKFNGDGLWLALVSVFFVISAIYIGIKDLIRKQ